MLLKYEHEGETIEFNVVFRKRKTLCIRVCPPKEVTVISPIGKSQKEILQTVQAKSKWIIKKLFDMKNMGEIPAEKQYVTGEEFFYLGEKYTLRIEEDEKFKRSKVVLKDHEILVCISKYDSDKARLALENWYKKQATEKISESIAYYQGFINVTPSNVVVKRQKRRWGSCTSSHKLLFNFKCVMLPLPILDYIVVHEMCHMVQLNHSKEFWALVKKILPDYKQRKEWLKSNGIMFEL